MNKSIPLAALALAALTLSGCSQITDALHRETEAQYPTYAEWVDGSPPSWVPEDSTNLRYRATTDEKVIEVRVVTGSNLVGDCSEQPRVQLPSLTDEWVPTKFPNDVMKCGDWEIMPVDDGWFGWYLATE